MRTTMDLNSDLGESLGDWRMGDDAAMLGIVSSANVACVFHAGDGKLALFQHFSHLLADGAGSADNGDVVGFFFHTDYPLAWATLSRTSCPICLQPTGLQPGS